MLNIKTEEQVIKKTVHKIGIWLTLLDLKRIPLERSVLKEILNFL